MTRLSVVLITKNEIANIRECLASVRFADEIVVVDSGSTDGTVDACRQAGVSVFETDWPGFGPQKNRALERARGEWVLSIDADERVMPELRAEIERAIADPASPDVFEIPRLSSYCGREMRHGGWWPDHVARLFRRGRARFSDDVVHERLVFEGQAGRLHAPLRHLSFRNLEQVLDKVNLYSSAGAQMLRARGRQGGLATAVVRGLWAFFRTYVLKAGFLDGREGFLLAVSNAEGVYYKYLKLMYLRDGK
jgi:glycosyltransferase involved in cell wall biosynthesis